MNNTSKQAALNSLKTNRTLANNDTFDIMDNYIDDICEDPKFLCENMELCGENTSIYTNVKNVQDI